MSGRNIEPEFSPVSSHCVHLCFSKKYYLVLTEEKQLETLK